MVTFKNLMDYRVVLWETTITVTSDILNGIHLERWITEDSKKKESSNIAKNKTFEFIYVHKILTFNNI